MAFHVVTSRCFLACESVTSVTFEEIVTQPKTLSKTKTKKSQKHAEEYSICITYYPTTPASSSYNKDEHTLDIRVRNRQKALQLFAEIIREVQEQYPNEAYLDKLVNNMLSQDEFKFVEATDADQ